MFQRKRWGGVGKVPRGFVCSFLLLIFVAASLLFPLSARAESGQADLDRLAPYADDGDLDYIPDYFVTVDLREDGSADIVYDITWQVIDGDQTDYLSWVKIGLPNAYAEDLTPLTDTISDLQYTGDGGSYAKVVFARRYYSPKVAAQNGGESRVRFAFSVHQSHLFSLNSDGTATFEFTPGWFDDLVVEHMQVRWRSGDGFVADNTSEEDGYLIWDFGPMGHGQSANIHVTVPVTTAETFDPDAQLTAADYDDGGMTADEMIGILTVVIGLLIFAAALIIIVGSMTPDWGGGFGSGLDPDDWFWYTNGVHTIHRGPHPAGVPAVSGHGGPDDGGCKARRRPPAAARDHPAALHGRHGPHEGGPALRSAGPSGGGSCLRPEPRRAGAADGAAALHRTLPPAGAAISGCLCAAAASGAGRRWRHPRVRPYSF